jgi:sodium/potassium-transporting ATPase subunit alpha
MTLNTNATWLTKEDADPKRSPIEVRDAILKRSTKGDASETALIKFVENYRPIEEYRAACPRKFLIPFNSVNKWAASINQLEDQNAPLYLLLKGAPDVVLAKCTNTLRLVNVSY